MKQMAAKPKYLLLVIMVLFIMALAAAPAGAAREMPVHVAPSDGTPGATADYTFKAYLQTDWYNDDWLVVHFPSEINVEGITLWGSTQQGSYTNNSGVGHFAGWMVKNDENCFILDRKGLGSHVPAGSIIEFTLTGIPNPASPGTYTITVETTTSGLVSPSGYLTRWGSVIKDSGFFDLKLPGYSSPLNLTSSGSGSIRMQDPVSESWYGPGTTFTAGTLVRLQAVPDSGWAFARWEGDLVGMDYFPPAFFVDGGMNITAVFVNSVHLDVSWDPHGRGTVSPGSGNYPVGLLELTATPSPGWHVDVWEVTDPLHGATKSYGGNSELIYMDRDKSLITRFREREVHFNITSDPGDPAPGGTVAIYPHFDTYKGTSAQTTHVELTATSAPGYRFDRWEYQVPRDSHANAFESYTSTANPLSFEVDTFEIHNKGYGDPTYLINGPVNLKAVFVTTDNFQLTTFLAGYGSIVRSIEGPDYEPGTEVTLTAIPSAGTEFSHWSGDLDNLDDKDPIIVVTMDRHKTIGAHFVSYDYDLTVICSPAEGGSVTLDPPGGTYPYRTYVNLTATPNPGWYLTGWSGIDTSGGDYVDGNKAGIDLRDNRTVTANFAESPYSATYNANGGTGTAPDHHNLREGDNFTAVANPFTAPFGTLFKEWNTAADGSGTGYAPGTTVTMPAHDLTLYAIWESGLFFSEYICGSSYDKALEIYNPSDIEVDLAAGNYKIEIYFTLYSDPDTTINLTGTIPPRSVYVIARVDADQVILGTANQTTSQKMFTGNDTIVLSRGTVILDVFGRRGEKPTYGWKSGDIQTWNTVLRRLPGVTQGDRNPFDAFDPALEWGQFDSSDFSGLGWHQIDDITRTVTFDAQGGSLVDSQTVNQGGLVIRPADPTKEGHDFAGWFTDTDYDTEWDFSMDTVTANMTLYARWTETTTPVLISLTVATNPDGIAITTGSGEYGSGETVLISAPESVDMVAGESRYLFIGWSGDGVTFAEASAPSTTLTMPAGAATVTANYVTQYRVTFAQSGIGDYSADRTTDVVVTVDGIAKTAADLPFTTDWLASGTFLTYNYASPVGVYFYNNETGDVVYLNERYTWASTSGLSQTQQGSTFAVTAAGTVTASYDKEYKIGFGVVNDYLKTDCTATEILTVTVNGIDKTGSELPFIIWAKAGDELSYKFADVLHGTSGTQYVWFQNSSSPGGLMSAREATLNVTRSMQAGGAYCGSLVTVSPTEQQYGDEVTFSLTISWYPYFQTVTDVHFCIGTQDMGGALKNLIDESNNTYSASLTVPLLETVSGQLAAGTRVVTAKLGNQDSVYNPTTSLTIIKADQTITFGSLADKTYGDAPFEVSAETSSGLPVSFAIKSGPASISGNTVTITGAGTVTITASQAGNDYYHAAPDVEQSFSVARADAAITVDAAALNQTYNGSPKVVTATPIPAGLGYNITYDGSATAPTNAGSYVVVATIDDINYQGSTSGTLTVNKADAIVSVAGYTGTYDGAFHGATGSATGVMSETLSGLDLGDSFKDVPGGTAQWVFTDITGNYKDQSGSVSITITPKDASVTPDDASKIYGDADPAFTGTLEGFLAADGVSATYSRTAGETVADSPYTISATLSPSEALGNYNVTYNTADFTITAATVNILYNGDQIVKLGESFVAKAQLTGPNATSINGIKVCFFLEDDQEKRELGVGITNSSGLVTLESINTSGWTSGVYTIIARTCDTNVTTVEDEATFTVADPGDAATGGGWYTLSGAGRVNFGFTVRQVPDTEPIQYKGQILLINNEKWRLKGELTDYVSVNHEGAASGTGKLYKWNAELNEGLGDWVLVNNNVTFTISFADNDAGGGTGRGKKTITPDTFGIHVNYIVGANEPTLPNSSPTELKGGNIDIKYTDDAGGDTGKTPPGQSKK